MLVKNDVTDIKALMSLESDMLQKHYIVDDYMQGEHQRAFICDLAEVMSKLYASGRERHAKQIIGLLRAKNFELNWLRETLKEVFAQLRLVRDTGNEKVKTIEF